LFKNIKLANYTTYLNSPSHIEFVNETKKTWKKLMKGFIKIGKSKKNKNVNYIV